MNRVVVTDYPHPQMKVVRAGQFPTILACWKAELPCCCQVWVGIRADNAQPGTCSLFCSHAHVPIIDSFHGKLIASLDHPTTRPAIDVVSELLNEAWEEYMTTQELEEP
jgi:hypothetical protein